MTLKYDNVYINSTYTIAGKYEKDGPLSSYYDKTYDNFYMEAKTFEQAEIKMLEEAINNIHKKVGKKSELIISGDLLNQIVASNYSVINKNIPFLGIYSACATSVEGLIIGANFVDKKIINNCLCATSSHNNSAEKQFRYPVEYGGIKPKTTTFTTTGACTAFLSRDKSNIKVESSTIGTVIDMGVKDVYNMGAVMAPACASTLYKHLTNLKRDINYYDLIISGDLGRYGKDILKDIMLKEHNIKLTNYDDAACMIYDLNKQDVYAGGSGPACLPLVTYGYILKKFKNKKILLLATGALMSPTMVNLKMSIPAICHAISLEVS